MIVINQAAQQITPFALLAQGWQFQWTGLTVLPFFAASALVYVFGGPVADKISNAVTRWQGGSREPEHHLANLILPLVSGVAGCFVFGTAGEQNMHWAVLLVGSFLIVFAFLTTMTILNVFIVESYPQWAGYVQFQSPLRKCRADTLADRFSSMSLHSALSSRSSSPPRRLSGSPRKGPFKHSPCMRRQSSSCLLGCLFSTSGARRCASGLPGVSRTSRVRRRRHSTMGLRCRCGNDNETLEKKTQRGSHTPVGLWLNIVNDLIEIDNINPVATDMGTLQSIM